MDDTVEFAAYHAGCHGIFLLAQQSGRLGGKRGVKFHGVACLPCTFRSYVSIAYAFAVAVGFHIDYSDVVVEVCHIVLRLHSLCHFYALAVCPQCRVWHSDAAIDDAAGRVLVDENLVIPQPFSLIYGFPAHGQSVLHTSECE